MKKKKKNSKKEEEESNGEREEKKVLRRDKNVRNYIDYSIDFAFNQLTETFQIQNAQYPM